ncbi:hypothetical protein [Phenylobacterium sp.]|uniref:hypothetical protein n=1 Tax=Phenylobacterium sp. TaxID=1871053 RepID=UPI002FDB10E5
MAEPGPRRAEVERLADYYALQLDFAHAVARRADLPLGEATRRFTNLHRRLALGEVAEAPGAGWLAFAGGLDAARHPRDRLAWTLVALAAAPDEPPLAGQVRFGCFALEPRSDGVVRIHFNNREASTTEGGPLSRARMAARRAELTAMFAHLQRRHPEAAEVHGASWLYHTEAYRRLFPADYTARPVTAEVVRLTGTSSWGQFLTHAGGVKPELREAFRARFDEIAPEAPWRIFPLRPLLVSAPVESFYRHFGLD